MNFTSLTFVVFFVSFFAFYWTLKNNHKSQNILILIGSYVFYGWWDYRFLFLMFFSSIVDYIIGREIYKSDKEKLRTWLMGLSLFINLGLLAYFKYLNFFIDTFVESMQLIGLHFNTVTLDIILPVGISFYTFQTLSYSLDIYKKKLKPTNDIIEFLGFVSFFPQLVAGPIERASALLPQFYVKRELNFEKAADGARLIVYGFFKKIVIADNISLRVDPIFANPTAYSGFELFLGPLFFLIQLYTDFSGYSDIARGTARLLGFDLMINFKTPFFASSVPESWRRWNISLTTWFRDYFFLWIVKFNINNTLWRIFSMISLFVVIGMWHGPNIKYAVFGFVMGTFFIPTLLAKNNDTLKGIIKICNTHPLIKPFAIIGTVSLFSLASVFFRAASVTDGINYYKLLVTNTFLGIDIFNLRMLGICIMFYTYEWFMKERDHQFDIKTFPRVIRHCMYVFVIACILLYGHFGDEPFYYFQF